MYEIYITKYIKIMERSKQFIEYLKNCWFGSVFDQIDAVERGLKIKRGVSEKIAPPVNILCISLYFNFLIVMLPLVVSR